MAVDSLNVGEALCSMPEQLATAHEPRGQDRPRQLLPSADDFDHIVTLGMGGSGIAGDILQAAGTASLPMPLDRAEALPHARVRRRAHTRVRAVVLGRHRGDARDGARCTLRRGAPHRRCPAAASSQEFAREHGAAPHRLPDPRRRCHGSRSGRSSRRSSWCSSAWACCPKGTPRCSRRKSSWSAGATSASPTPTRRATRRASSRARSGARSRSSTAPEVSAPWPRCGGSARSTRTPRLPRTGTSIPSSTTTRSAAGASTATSPARSSRSSSCTRASSTRSSNGAWRATRELIDEAVNQVIVVEAEGEGRLAQLLDVIYLGDWTSYYLALDNDVDPGPIDAIAQLKSDGRAHA